MNSVTMEISALVPQAPCPAPAEAEVSILVSGSEMFATSGFGLLMFQYIGMSIESVTPGSGISCPGSGGVELTLIISNIGAVLPNLNISMASYPMNISCIVTSQGDGDRAVVKAMTPELPLGLLGSVEIELALSGGPGHDEGNVAVQIYSSTMPENVAKLTFTYYDNHFPAILRCTPKAVYSQGGETVTVYMRSFPLVKDEKETSIVLRSGDEEPVVVPLVSMAQGSSGADVATLIFTAPQFKFCLLLALGMRHRSYHVLP